MLVLRIPLPSVSGIRYPTPGSRHSRSNVLRTYLESAIIIIAVFMTLNYELIGGVDHDESIIGQHAPETVYQTQTDLVMMLF